MMWILTVLAAAWAGKLLAKAAVRHRPVFTYRCGGCGEHYVVMDSSVMNRSCPACNEVTRRIYDSEKTQLHRSGQKRLESKAQAIAAITAGTIAGFLYGFMF